jgi:hypothetical protein
MVASRILAAALLALLAACAPPAASERRPPAPIPALPPSADDAWVGLPAPEVAAPPPAPEAAALGRDFGEEARLLFRVAACGSDAPLPPGLDARLIDAHCREIRPKIEAYKARYVAVAAPFLAGIEPPGLPAEVVYPFGGGDLVTALTTYPAGQRFTTVSLELVGDPRRIRGMGADALDRSLKRLRGELGELFWIENYSRSETLKRTQRGDIPGELVLFLVGLAVHGYEPVSLRYFTLGPEGTIHYLSEREIDDADHSVAQHRKASWTPPDFSEAFANAEITFRPRGAAADAPVRVHRHIAANLADEPLRKDPALLRHLEGKGPVSAMTKAASYLLWSDAFSSIRGYLLGHAAFMVSDSTGIPPAFAAEAGMVQETYGKFKGSLLRASPAHNAAFRKLWEGQPLRKLSFRYGYLSGREAHLLVTRKPPPAAP